MVHSQINHNPTPVGRRPQYLCSVVDAVYGTDIARSSALSVMIKLSKGCKDWIDWEYQSETSQPYAVAQR
jgi:hypothetical protein